MEDLRDVSAELHRIADNEQFEPLQSDQLLNRGRRGRRRRMIFAASGAVAAVAAVAVAVSLVPNLVAADNKPQVATTTTARPQNPDFEPVPGILYGEAAADQRIAQPEAERRCALRNPKETRPLQRQGDYRVGDTTRYEIKTGQKYAECTVPGGDRPKPAIIAAAAANPLPQNPAALLRKCSVQAWIDLTDWKVVASDRSTELARALVLAVSPSGRKLVECDVSRESAIGPMSPVRTAFFTLDRLDGSDPAMFPIPKDRPADLYTAGGGSLGSCGNNGVCTGYNYVGWGRVSATATEVRLSIGNSPVTKVPVRNGWFAFTWAVHAKYNGKTQPKVIAYDKTGKLVRDFSN
ncbi:hypothetical protein [Kribbella sp. NPDC048928]|uniref:hypothetical protein n=1 Tax=Kribbella sp. NPDC048928 TaxID=3364111 RepID=UPI0037218A12